MGLYNAFFQDSNIDDKVYRKNTESYELFSKKNKSKRRKKKKKSDIIQDFNF